MVQGKILPHLTEVRIPSALPKQCVRVCSVDYYRQIKKKKKFPSIQFLGIDGSPIFINTTTDYKYWGFGECSYDWNYSTLVCWPSNEKFGYLERAASVKRPIDVLGFKI